MKLELCIILELFLVSAFLACVHIKPLYLTNVNKKLGNSNNILYCI